MYIVDRNYQGTDCAKVSTDIYSWKSQQTVHINENSGSEDNAEISNG